MASAGLQQLFDELKAVVLEADAALGRADDAPVHGTSDAPDAALPDPAPTAAERLRARAGVAAESTADFVRDHPWQALGVAALAGFALGWLSRRK